MKFLEENVGKNLLNIIVSDFFLGMSSPGKGNPPQNSKNK